MDTAIVGFLGVVVGALATSASTWFFARRVERREKKIAGRIIREDVVLAGSTLEAVLTKGWIHGRSLPVAGWREHRATLAAELDRPAWDQVSEAMETLEMVATILEVLAEGENLAGGDIPPDSRETVVDSISRLKQANLTLASLR